MPSYRIGFGSDFTLKNQKLGVGTDTASVELDIRGTASFNTADLGVSTFSSYTGFSAQEYTNTDLVIGSDEYSTTGDIVVGIGSTFVVSVGATVDVGTVPSVSIGTHFSPPTGGIEDRPEVPVEGTVRFNRDLNTLEFYNGIEWRQFNTFVSGGTRGFISGGFGDDQSAPQGQRKEIQYFNVASQGNSILFGELTDYALCDDSCASSTRVVNLHGTKAAFNNIIDYFQMATTGNAVDFGDATITGARQANVSSSTRGIFCGRRTPSYVNTIDYVEMNTLGNALDFGDLTVGTGGAASGSSPTRGVVSGGYPYKQNIDVITIASKGDAVKFGEAAFTGSYQDGCSNQTRALFAGGYNIDNSTKNANISSLYIASDGNATMFGELSIKRAYMWGAGIPTRGFFGGGIPTHNVIHYISMQSGGEMVDFGDMTKGAYQTGAITNAHGGIGGY